ncbi:MAG: hypothetical protein MUP81_06200 [Dehalococcoidia bacterium]|nr:hypothetical protein [Dehalococcoidia bacterium]
MSKKHKKRLKEMTEEINPDELMPLPKRLKEETIEEEIIEAPVKPQEAVSEVSIVKDVSSEPEAVEPGFVSTKVNLYIRR